MNITIMGAGAVGAYFGALLARAGQRVGFVARGEHLSAIRSAGLKVIGERGEWSVEGAAASDEPADLPEADVVLFCVKQYDTEQAAALCRNSLKPEGICISLQNGVDAFEKLAPFFGADRVLPGLAYVSALVSTPGVIRYTSEMSSLTFGPVSGDAPETAHQFLSCCLCAGIGAKLSADIRSDQWEKFVILSTNSALTALSRLPAGHLYRRDDLAPIVRRTVEEVCAVATASGVILQPDVVQRSMTLAKSFPASMYASMYHDLRQGKRLELESLSGHVVRRGRELGIPTPIHELAYLLLKPFVDGPPRLGE